MTENVIAFPLQRSTPAASQPSEIVSMLLGYVDLAQRGKIRSLAVITTSDDWRHGLEMLTDDGDASDLATTLELAKQRCLRKIGE